MTSDVPKEFLNRLKASALLGVNPQIVDRLIRSGRLLKIDVGGRRVVIPRRAIYSLAEKKGEATE